MENITKINENLYRLTTAYKDIFTTVYLIKTPGGALLFDAASFDKDADSICALMGEAGVTADELKYVFVSHKHNDHAGGLGKLMQVFPDMCILSRSEQLKEEYKQYKFIAPQDNDAFLDVLKVITIPGHTQDSAAILDLRTNTLITGDCLQLYGIFGSQDWACNINLPAAHFEALKKVRTLEVSQIYMAHDYHPVGFMGQGSAEVERIIDACEAPLLFIKRLIAEHPEMDDAQIRELYNHSDKIPTVTTNVVAAMRAAMKDL